MSSTIPKSLLGQLNSFTSLCEISLAYLSQSCWEMKKKRWTNPLIRKTKNPVDYLFSLIPAFTSSFLSVMSHAAVIKHGAKFFASFSQLSRLGCMFVPGLSVSWRQACQYPGARPVSIQVKKCSSCLNSMLASLPVLNQVKNPV